MMVTAKSDHQFLTECIEAKSSSLDSEYISSPYELPTRAEALRRLHAFLPRAGVDYAKNRNFDLGVGGHVHVSLLSAYLSRRMISQEEVLSRIARFESIEPYDKFIQEVCWHIYWHGWVEHYPHVWHSYRQQLKEANSEHQALHRAIQGKTDIPVFNQWVEELRSTGYLHNHARMWFASIWIFTLRLPWVQGAAFFLDQLIDADPAVNTLSWRWVAGLHTRGKSYLARPSNIAKYTKRTLEFCPLNTEAFVVQDLFEKRQAQVIQRMTTTSRPVTALLIMPADLSIDIYLEGIGRMQEIEKVAILNPRLIQQSGNQKVHDFDRLAIEDCYARLSRTGRSVSLLGSLPELLLWLRQIRDRRFLVGHPPVGPQREFLSALEKEISQEEVSVERFRRKIDDQLFPHAGSGFFKMQKQIQKLMETLR